MNKKIFKTKKAVALYCLLGCALILWILSLFEVTAEYVFARGISVGLNFLASRIFYLLPFSAYEFLSYLLIAGGVAFLIFCIIKRKHIKKILYILCLVVLSVFMFYTSAYGALYNRMESFQSLGVTSKAVTTENLSSALDFYLQNIQKSQENLTRDKKGNVENPYTNDQMFQLLNDEFNRVNNGYFYDYYVKPKSVLSSDALSYLRISGIYFPFTGEANINTNTSSYELPVTVAHEMAHAKGVSQENQANFLAYYLCINAPSSYLNYSGNLSAALVLLSALKKTDAGLYQEYRKKIPQEINLELQNDSEEYQKYESFLGGISQFFNNLFLKANGVADGTVSYSRTTQYLVSLENFQKLS